MIIMATDEEILNSPDYCWYSPAEHHSACTHQNYCILNDNRHMLEVRISGILEKINHIKKLLHNISISDGNYEDDYSSLQKKLSIYEDDLRTLRLTEHKALTGELTGYAHND